MARRPVCPTSDAFRIAGYRVGRCPLCGQLAPLYGGRLVSHPTLRQVPGVSGGAK